MQSLSVELHEVHMTPLLQIVQVPLDCNSSLRCVNSTTHLVVICKLTEGALDTTLCVSGEVIKYTGPSIGPLETSPVTDCYLDIEPLATVLWVHLQHLLRVYSLLIYSLLRA